MRLSRGFLAGLVAGSFMLIAQLEAPAAAAVVAGGGTYFVAPGMRSEFQFNKTHVQCKVGHGVMPDGTVFQMFMFSTSVDSVAIDTAAQSAVLKGTMVSEVNLRFTDGTSVTLTETVPFVAYAKDNGTPGAGADFFSLTVLYKDTAGFDQFDLFGSPATFAGTVVTGNITIK